MRFYLIEAIDQEGKKQKKVLSVTDESEIFPLLEFSGLIPLKIKKLPDYYRYLNIRKYIYRIKRQEIIEVLENLHLIVKSGLPINTGLMDLAEDAENPSLKEMLFDMAFKIQAGETLSQAAESYRDIFSDVVISLFKIGEETGSLDKTLKDAAEHLKKIEDLKAKTKQALIYPAFAFFSVLGAMIFWLVYVLPKIIDAFKDFNIELPATTVFIMKTSDFLRSYGIFLVVVIFILFILLQMLRKKNEKIRIETDRLILKIPVIGIIIENFNYAFFAEYVRLMIQAGLPLYQALNIMENAIRNYVFKTAIRNSRNEIELGRSFSDSLKKENVFSPLIIRMISIGEQTGALDEQLDYISNYYYNKVEYISQNIAKMIEPIIIGVVGGFMLIVMLGFIGPIYDLISQIGRM
ncbi:MAG TPA: type II secretion system F family protein [Persephonella sp.]|uniref:Putative type II secretion system protein n=1 Tax=Persephonella marina (strain DSM 14350 / EX-H1) TaxID=123214 RepID=C0QQ18_PERMH|nr:MULTISPECIES: type II secretion system F family protein [Persephonella]ACO03462.1 putative type II secretion system protein [Persephonella marina EX-H1]HCB69621.1 type II secretion system F family protein [Persephonella sp.]